MSTYGLLWYLSDEYTDRDVNMLDEAIAALADHGDWVLGPPTFIDEAEELNSKNPEDESIRTVGGFLELQPPSEQMDKDIERRQYHEVVRVVEALSAFSGKAGCEIEMELGGVYVGDIKHGVPSKLISVGFLEEWKRTL